MYKGVIYRSWVYVTSDSSMLSGLQDSLRANKYVMTAITGSNCSLEVLHTIHFNLMSKNFWVKLLLETIFPLFYAITLHLLLCCLSTSLRERDGFDSKTARYHLVFEGISKIYLLCLDAFLTFVVLCCSTLCSSSFLSHFIFKATYHNPKPHHHCDCCWKTKSRFSHENILA